MGYSESTIVLGGLVHVPILISLLWFFDKRTSKAYAIKKAAEDKAKAQAAAAAEQGAHPGDAQLREGA